MAKYTVEVSSLVCAHAFLIDRVKNNRQLQINDDYFGKYKTFNFSDFSYKNPNEVINDYARSFFDRHLGNGLLENITTNQELNDEIYNQLCRTLVRHFWGYEIGQENPEYFFVLLREQLDQYLPIWYQGYQKLFVDKAQWVTNTNDSNTLTKSVNDSKQDTAASAINGNADTPQNELDFSLNTGDPAKDYNFHYASDVSGSKSIGNTIANQTGTNEMNSHSEGRNNTIVNLLNEMLAYSNGIYFELFNRLKAADLFMGVF